MVKSMEPVKFAVPVLDSDVESEGEDEKPRMGYGYHRKAPARYVEERAPQGAYPFARTA